MKRLIIATYLLLASCGATPQAAVAPSVFDPSDLPKKFGSFATPLPWRIYPGAKQTDKTTYFEIYQGERTNEVGHVAVMEYDNASDRASIENIIQGEMGYGDGIPKSESSIGERATSITDTLYGADVVFIRCTAVVHINMSDLADAIAVARRVDERVKTSLCK